MMFKHVQTTIFLVMISSFWGSVVLHLQTSRDHQRFTPPVSRCFPAQVGLPKDRLSLQQSKVASWNGDVYGKIIYKWAIFWGNVHFHLYLPYFLVVYDHRHSYSLSELQIWDAANFLTNRYFGIWCPKVTLL